MDYATKNHDNVMLIRALRNLSKTSKYIYVNTFLTVTKINSTSDNIFDNRDREHINPSNRETFGECINSVVHVISGKH